MTSLELDDDFLLPWISLVETSILRSLGWTSHEAEQYDRHPSSRFARVARVDAQRCHLLTPDGPMIGVVPGRLCHNQLVRPTVGDWVALERYAPLVTAVLERRTRIARAAAGRNVEAQVIAANVDRVFVVMGLDRDFNLRRLERYLALCADAGVDVVVLLTKARGCMDVVGHVERCRAVAMPSGALAVHAIDVVDGIAADLPNQYIEDTMTIALLGSSGAGKSTLANYLLGTTYMATGAVRRGDDRGRHTTVHRELVQLTGGGLLIDNPGMRELALWLDHGGLQRTFNDVSAWAAHCRFNDCSHRGEPGCAVEEAVQRGELDGLRVESFHRLQHEVEVTDLRRDTKRRREHERKRSKLYRRAQKQKRGRR